ncbi:MAG: hypothetical protein RBR07_04140, partial [Arcobacteraceae bacterium]|nr:hypothetical protein [Arcobacteraceae bacterium]
MIPSLTVKQKFIFVLFSIISTFVVSIGIIFYSFNSIQGINKITNSNVAKELSFAELSNDVNFLIISYNKDILLSAITKNNNTKHFIELKKNIEDKLTLLEEIIKSSNDKQLIEAIDSLKVRFNGFTAIAGGVFEEFEYSLEDGILALEGLQKVGGLLDQEISALVAIANERLESSIKTGEVNIETQISSSNTLILLFIALSIVGLTFTVYAISKSVMNSLDSLNDGLQSFFSFLNKEIPSSKYIEINTKDEFANMAEIVNKNIKDIEQGLQEDDITVKEALETVQKVNNGYLNIQISSNPHNPQLIALKDSLNSMIRSTKSNIDSVQKVLAE